MFENVISIYKRDQLPPEKDMMLIQEGPLIHMKAWMKHYKTIGCPHVVTREERPNGRLVPMSVFRIFKRRVV